MAVLSCLVQSLPEPWMLAQMEKAEMLISPIPKSSKPFFLLEVLVVRKNNSPVPSAFHSVLVTGVILLSRGLMGKYGDIFLLSQKEGRIPLEYPVQCPGCCSVNCRAQGSIVHLTSNMTWPQMSIPPTWKNWVPGVWEFRCLSFLPCCCDKMHCWFLPFSVPLSCLSFFV